MRFPMKCLGMRCVLAPLSSYTRRPTRFRRPASAMPATAPITITLTAALGADAALGAASVSLSA